MLNIINIKYWNSINLQLKRKTIKVYVKKILNVKPFKVNLENYLPTVFHKLILDVINLLFLHFGIQ